jgi:hypothetical protein
MAASDAEPRVGQSPESIATDGAAASLTAAPGAGVDSREGVFDFFQLERRTF